MQRYRFRLAAGEQAPDFLLDLDASHPHDALILRFAAAQKSYEPEVYRLLGTVLRPGDTVLDVGAHIGFFTVLAARIVGPGGRVVAFEPEAASHARLLHHVRLNELGNVTLIEQPACERPGEVDFYVHSPGSGGNALWDPALFPGASAHGAAARVQRRVATTLDAEAKRLGLSLPKLIKIDTEGAEQRVLEGAAELLQGAVPFVVCELHEFGLLQLGCSPQSLRGLMAGFGYETFTLFGDGSLPKLIPPGTLLSSGVFLNILFSRVESVGRCWPVEVVDKRQILA
jgi:FkbM family methyltransferase